MDDATTPPVRAPRRAVSRRSALLGLATVGAIAAVDVGGFLCAAGTLDADALTQARLTDRFEEVSGHHDGFRRNHAKGVSATGYFIATGAGSAVSTASVFRVGRIPVTGRFSLSGGNPSTPDADATVRGLGLAFDLPDGEQWRTAMINTPVFPDRTPDGFYKRLLASKKDPATGKPDPDRMAAFLSRHPETAAAMNLIRQHPPTSGFDNSTFYGLNAFHCTNDTGGTVPVRWTLVPAQPVRSPGLPPLPGRDHLFDALTAAVSRGPLRWRMLLTIGQPGDRTDDATRPWPPTRQVLDVGTVTIEAVRTEAPHNARDLNFDPLILPMGIAPSDDPLLSARSAVYTESFTRRSGEPKTPALVDVDGVRDDR
ncbi:catalase family peroxidase [Rhodococcus opacus]|uniref:Catalase-related peroxidase n=1 Tax=Rhodococcus opacus TaxID=37919 RepID=A0A2S8IX16_RHOOP|nr:catalase family peroxidase [Rhodococcus opacus]PQP19317.1 catalase [Rhodococcus opacus]